mgnify:CR=1 FL=1
MDKYEEIKKIIANAGDVVQFSDYGNGVSVAWIQKAEERLGFELPPTYKWWLVNYGGGEVYGDEIFSIYEQDFDLVCGGDLVYMHELNQKNKMYTDFQLVISQTDFDIYYFDLRKRKKDGEIPIFSWSTQKEYAEDFIDFLKRIIKA